MSDAYTIPNDTTDAVANRRWLRWPIAILVLMVLVWLAGVGITLLIRHTALQQRLTHRLESVFGRHVEVGNYDFSLWSGPTLVAESITFSEDPRFGHEYFLRADALKVRLHWQSLFRGRVDLGTVSLERPSLNLVRDAAGDWNVGEWLPRITSETPSAVSASAPAPSAHASNSVPYVRFDRILFDDGRINFKRSDEKIPFAFIGVAGSVEPDAPGRWRIDLEAVPTRAAVPLQQPGLVHVAAQVGGTSSRFRPANLSLSWQEGSVADLLRLTRGYDFGVRGDFALAINAHTDGDDWLLETRTLFRSLHRWDLTLRPDDPDFNVLANFTVHPQAPGFDIEHAVIEGHHSRAEASAHVLWNAASNPVHVFASAAHGPDEVAAPTEIQIQNSTVDLADVLGCLRAFHTDIAADAELKGFAELKATFAAGPARLASAEIQTDHAEFSSSTLRVPATVGALHLHFDHGGLSVDPALVSFGSATNALRIESSAKSTPRDAATYRVSGSLDHARDLIATAAALGWPISRGWDVRGPAQIDLRWPATSTPWRAQPTGTIDWGDEIPTLGVTPDTDPAGAIATGRSSREATLLAPFLNEAIRGIRAHVEFRPDGRRVTLNSADAFGSRWTGTLERHYAAPGWQFALSADHLATADVDRWLNPRWRQSLLDRMLPFLGNAAPVATPDDLFATGRISIDQLTVAPIVARHVQGDLKLSGRTMEFSAASAQLDSGNVTGTMRAAFTAAPEFHVALNFSGVDLGDLSATSPPLAGQFDGAATGEITLASHGATRSDLAAALVCEGTARVTSPVIKKFNLDQTFRAGESRPGPEAFREGTAEFTCADSAIDFEKLTLTSATGRMEATGSVDFSRRVDLTFTTPSAPNSTFSVTGPLASPAVKQIAGP